VFLSVLGLQGCELGLVWDLGAFYSRRSQPLGMIAMELHTLYNATWTLHVVAALEAAGYRLFHSERNPYCFGCYEVALIHETLVLPAGQRKKGKGKRGAPAAADERGARGDQRVKGRPEVLRFDGGKGGADVCGARGEEALGLRVPGARPRATCGGSPHDWGHAGPDVPLPTAGAPRGVGPGGRLGVPAPPLAVSRGPEEPAALAGAPPWEGPQLPPRCGYHWGQGQWGGQAPAEVRGEVAAMLGARAFVSSPTSSARSKGRERGVGCRAGPGGGRG